MIPLVLLLFVLFFEAIEAAVTYLIEPSLPWYFSAVKPPFVPAPWVFRIAWIGAYLFIGASFILLWSKRHVHGAENAMRWFLWQILLNALWLWIATRIHSITGGMVVLVALVYVTAVAALKAFRVRRIASVLLIPYLCWICFMLYLDAALYLLNTG
jgi:translocator protein